MILLVLACALISDADLAKRFDVDGDGIARPDDCDDRDAAVGDATSWHVDADGDGFGGQVEGTDCAPDVGYVADGSDCDDANSDANPEAEERCDAIDNDCDGATDEDSAVDAPTWYRDADGDTYGVTDDALVSCGAPAGYAAASGDCNDADATVNPGVREACDGRDEDCSGVVDDPYWWRDADEDGYGDPADSTIACDAPGGYVEYGTDCDDVDAAVNPGADEVCDDADVDEDCDGSTDDDDDDVVGRVAAFADDDGDGWGNPDRAVPPACELTAGYSWTDTDCDDTRADVNPEATEACYDGLDQDCDGASDDDCDLDGFLDSGRGGDDCDDENAAINPAAVEACENEVDENCDGVLAGTCGISGDVDLADADWVVRGDTAHPLLGHPVLLTDDVTGDGVADIVVGAQKYSSSLPSVYIFAADGVGDAVVDASTVVLAGSPIGGGVSGITTADFDGDGQNDLLAGDYYDGYGRGVASFYYGPIVTSMYGDAAATVSGTSDYASVGMHVGAGDLDGDGVAEALVSSQDESLNPWVTAYSMADRANPVAVAAVMGVSLGVAWSFGLHCAAGDINGDGNDDMLIGDYVGDDYRGVIYAFTDSMSASNVADADLTITGGEVEDYLSSPQFVEDADGDGLGDVLLSASMSDANGADSGAAYLFSGATRGAVGVSAADATFYGEAAGDHAGSGSSGDLNGDGLSDLLIGAWNHDSAGAAYVVLSPVSGTTTLSAANGRLHGESAAARAGTSVSSGVDVGGDGFDDLVVGAYMDSTAGTWSGAAYRFDGGPP